MLLKSFIVFEVWIYKNIVNGTKEMITEAIKNIHLFQKSAPSILQKIKNANKFEKIIRLILIIYFCINQMYNNN